MRGWDFETATIPTRVVIETMLGLWLCQGITYLYNTA
jgi:hypothetical protein